MKYLIAGVGIIALIVIAVFAFREDEYNIRQAQELNTVLESSNVGSLRASFEEDSDGSYGIQARHVLNELKLEIADRYSEVPEVQLEYVFFDDEDNEYALGQAEERDDIVGIQFKVTTIDGNGEAMSSTSERRVLDKKE